MRRACERRPVPICAQVKPRDRLYIWFYELLKGGFLYSCLEVSVSKYPVLSCLYAPESESGCGRWAFSFLVLVAQIRGCWGAALGRLLKYQ